MLEPVERRCLPATGSGAALVADIQPGAGSSRPDNLVNVNGTLYFSAYSQNEQGLWTSDGTAAGTKRVAVIQEAGISEMAAVGNLVFFATSQNRVWRSDGTEAGTVPLSPYISGSTPGSYGMTAVGNRLFFVWRTEENGRELWVSDGTAAGTKLVKDIYPGTSDEWVWFGVTYQWVHANESLPNDLTDFNGTLFFSAYDEQHGRELWKSDGTAAGTTLVKNISADGKSKNKVNSSNPHGLAVVNGVLYFGAAGGLWRSDGTTAGTVLIKQIAGLDAPLYIQGITAVNGTFYFSANDGTHGAELWKSDGTAAGTAMVKDIMPGGGGSGPRFLNRVNGALVFLAEDGAHGMELWRSDGTAAGTVLVKDIYPGGTGITNNYAFSPDLTDVNGRLYLAADDGAHGIELWQSDGTAAGTVMVQDINPGGAFSSPQALTTMNNKLYFAADDGEHGIELWDPPAVEATSTPVRTGDPGVHRTAQATRPEGPPVVGGAADLLVAPPTESPLGPWTRDLLFVLKRGRRPR